MKKLLVLLIIMVLLVVIPQQAYAYDKDTKMSELTVAEFQELASRNFLVTEGEYNEYVDFKETISLLVMAIAFFLVLLMFVFLGNDTVWDGLSHLWSNLKQKFFKLRYKVD